MLAPPLETESNAGGSTGINRYWEWFIEEHIRPSIALTQRCKGRAKDSPGQRADGSSGKIGEVQHAPPEGQDGRKTETVCISQEKKRCQSSKAPAGPVTKRRAVCLSLTRG